MPMRSKIFYKILAYTSASASTREAIKWGAYAEQDVVFFSLYKWNRAYSNVVDNVYEGR